MLRSIEDVLDFLGIEYKLAGQSPHVSEGWVGIKCPYCGVGTKNYGMGLRIFGNYLKSSCWKCGPHNAIKTLYDAATRFPDLEVLPYFLTNSDSNFAHKSRISDFGKVRLLLAGLTEILNPTQNLKGKNGFYQPPMGVEPLSGAVFKKFIVKQWNLDPDYLAETWKIQQIGKYGESKYAWSLFIPIFDETGKEVSWICRHIGDARVRYGAAPKHRAHVSHKQILYGEHLAEHCVIVNEGCADAWAVGPGGCCVFGTGYTQSQLLRISRFPMRVIVMDSNSPESIARGKKLSDELSIYPGETYEIQLETGKDASRCSAKELRLLRSFLK